MKRAFGLSLIVAAVIGFAVSALAARWDDQFQRVSTFSIGTGGATPVTVKAGLYAKFQCDGPFYMNAGTGLADAGSDFEEYLIAPYTAFVQVANDTTLIYFRASSTTQACSYYTSKSIR